MASLTSILPFKWLPKLVPEHIIHEIGRKQQACQPSSAGVLEDPQSPYEHYGCFSCGDLDGFPPLLALNTESELAADSVSTDSARLDSVSSVSSPSLELRG